MSMTLEIPDDVEAALPGTGGERDQWLRLELACTLYAREVLSLGRAAELAGMSKFDFGYEVGGRGIPRHYSEADLAADFAYARGE